MVEKKSKEEYNVTFEKYMKFIFLCLSSFAGTQSHPFSPYDIWMLSCGNSGAESSVSTQWSAKPKTFDTWFFLKKVC